MRLLLCSVLLIVLFSSTKAQIRAEARWCCINNDELSKCEALTVAIFNRERTGDPYPPGMKSYDMLPKLECVLAKDRFTCMQMIADNEADLIQLDPGMGYTAGEYFTMMPLVAERYVLGEGQTGLTFKAVAVARKNQPGINIKTLQGKKACHPSVGQAAGWVYPVSTLIEQQIMPITECNVPVKSAASFFGDMCAPNGLARFYNPFGNNPVTVCENCKGEGDEYCTGNDPYADYAGAFDCIASGNGDVAFIRDSTILSGTANSSTGIQPEEFELLCLDGTRAAHTAFDTCNWGSIPSHTVMTSAIRDLERRNNYKMLLSLMSLDFGEAGTYTRFIKMFDSSRYSRRNVLFTDETKELVDVGARDSYYTWVGEEYRRRLGLLNSCPSSQARICVISRHEMKKCENMIMAFSAKGLKPDLNCILGTSIRDCMDKIRTGDSDLMSLDAADVFVAGKYYGLVPIAKEDYSGIDAANYLSVAVARKTDSHLTIFNLKSRRSCHSAVYTAAGWIVPVDKLIETGQIVIKTCNVYHAVGQFFSKSCVPGILDDSYNPYNTNPVNLCEACAAGGRDRCMRNDEELYFGNSGAFRCLTERGGDVAFVKHTTVRENTDGRNIAEWARNRRSDDYELLCNDGTRAPIDSWEDCNMGSIPPNALVTASFKTKREREIYWTLLNYAQQFFASDSNADFQMFSSTTPNHKDLIFQDSTVRLVSIPEERQNYIDYLGEPFVRAMERMENIDCLTAGAAPFRVPHCVYVCVALLSAIAVGLF